jgi:fermentation-respiration switch protein FrsA (DUF1100 family)
MTALSSSNAATVVEPVSFIAEDAALTGNLYLPAKARDGAELLGIVVTGTWTSVKEQMANRYAQRLAERGLAALSFDFTGFGLSGGEPREVESPSLKARDIRSAVSCLHQHAAIDGSRIGALAICASAGYAASAAIHDRRLRALAMVAPWLHDAKLLREVYGGEDGVRDRQQAGEAARERYARTGVVDYVPVADPDDQRAAMPMKIDFYDNPARGAVLGWPNRFAVMAWTEWLAFDAVALAPAVPAPTLIVHSEEAAIPDGARRFYEALTCPREIVWTEGTQFDFYDQEPQVGFAVEQAIAHFERHL